MALRGKSLQPEFQHDKTYVSKSAPFGALLLITTIFGWSIFLSVASVWTGGDTSVAPDASVVKRFCMSVPQKSYADYSFFGTSIHASPAPGAIA